jgi:DMSO/TMAO reductase YedYZ molybdopterin-dependent catalytic subunit
VEVDLTSLRRLPAVEVTKTLECISNFAAKCELAPFGCDLISTARWKGVRVSDVLALAGGPRPGAVSLATFAADEFTTALPIEIVMQPDTLLVYEMNGQVLPREHGYPVRMLVPGRYGMKNAKWVVGIRALRTEHVDWYGQRNWNRQGVVKTMSRIDVPADGARLPTGRHRIAGVAYAGDRGINGVQFSGDGGRTWNPAVLLEAASGRDAWVRWQAEFDLAPGQRLTLTARAFDGQGQVQPSVFRLPQPDGGSGLPRVGVSGE